MDRLAATMKVLTILIALLRTGFKASNQARGLQRRDRASDGVLKPVLYP
jgi:hypothetical protein